MEKLAVLENEGDGLTQGILAVVFNGEIPDSNLSFIRFVETGKKLCNGGFSRTGVPHKGIAFSLFQAEGKTFQNLLVSVGKIYILELHTVILELFFPAVLEAVLLHCFVELFHFIDGKVCIENVHAGPHDFHESHHDDAVQKENHNQIDD